MILQNMAGILSEDAEIFLYVTSIEEAYKLVAEFVKRSTTKVGNIGMYHFKV